MCVVYVHMVRLILYIVLVFYLGFTPVVYHPLYCFRYVLIKPYCIYGIYGGDILDCIFAYYKGFLVLFHLHICK